MTIVIDVLSRFDNHSLVAMAIVAAGLVCYHYAVNVKHPEPKKGRD